MLRREVSVRGLVAATLTILFLGTAVGAIFDREGRVQDLALASLFLSVLILNWMDLKQTAAEREQRAQRRRAHVPKVYTARKRRAVGMVIVLIAYLMVRPDRHGSIAVALPYSVVFCGLILLVLEVRKQHLVWIVQRLTGRSRSGR